MKRLISKMLILVTVGFIFASCDKKDSGFKSTFFLDLTSWDLPDTTTVNTPFDLSLNSAIKSTCTHGLSFEVLRTDDKKYNVYAQTTYENNGEPCYDDYIHYDTTISITHTSVGRYYYFFLSEGAFKKDSIEIIP